MSGETTDVQYDGASDNKDPGMHDVGANEMPIAPASATGGDKEDFSKWDWAAMLSAVNGYAPPAGPEHNTTALPETLFWTFDMFRDLRDRVIGFNNDLIDAVATLIGSSGWEGAAASYFQNRMAQFTGNVGAIVTALNGGEQGSSGGIPEQLWAMGRTLQNYQVLFVEVYNWYMQEAVRTADLPDVFRWGYEHLGDVPHEVTKMAEDTMRPLLQTLSNDYQIKITDTVVPTELPTSTQGGGDGSDGAGGRSPGLTSGDTDGSQLSGRGDDDGPPGSQRDSGAGPGDSPADPQQPVIEQPVIEQPEVPQLEQPAISSPDLFGLSSPNAGSLDVAGPGSLDVAAPNLSALGSPSIGSPDSSALGSPSVSSPDLSGVGSPAASPFPGLAGFGSLGGDASPLDAGASAQANPPGLAPGLGDLPAGSLSSPAPVSPFPGLAGLGNAAAARLHGAAARSARVNPVGQAVSAFPGAGALPQSVLDAARAAGLDPSRLGLGAGGSTTLPQSVRDAARAAGIDPSVLVPNAGSTQLPQSVRDAARAAGVNPADLSVSPYPGKADLPQSVLDAARAAGLDPSRLSLSPGAGQLPQSVLDAARAAGVDPSQLGVSPYPGGAALPQSVINAARAAGLDPSRLNDLEGALPVTESPANRIEAIPDLPDVPDSSRTPASFGNPAETGLALGASPTAAPDGPAAEETPAKEPVMIQPFPGSGLEARPLETAAGGGADGAASVSPGGADGLGGTAGGPSGSVSTGPSGTAIGSGGWSPLGATGAAGGADAASVAAGGAGATGGHGGMPPMMPPMGGAGGGGGDERKNERDSWLQEDRDVWGEHTALAGPVLGSAPGSAEGDATPQRGEDRPGRRGEQIRG